MKVVCCFAGIILSVQMKMKNKLFDWFYESLIFLSLVGREFQEMFTVRKVYKKAEVDLQTP
jgi:hypothetical protein